MWGAASCPRVLVQGICAVHVCALLGFPQCLEHVSSNVLTLCWLLSLLRWLSEKQKGYSLFSPTFLIVSAGDSSASLAEPVLVLGVNIK